MSDDTRMDSDQVDIDHPPHQGASTMIDAKGKDQYDIVISLHDLLGAPIKNLMYAVERETAVIAMGVTSDEGELKKISYSLGDVLDIFVEKFGSNELKKIKSLPLTDATAKAKLRSGKVVFDVDLQEHEGGKENYKRKTYVVKKGDTLDGIAKANGTTARELSRLNDIADANHISIGMVIKLPLTQPNTGGGGGGGDAGGGAAAAPASAAGAPASSSSASPASTPAAGAANTPAATPAPTPTPTPAAQPATKSAAAPAAAAGAPAAAPAAKPVDKTLIPARSENSGSPKVDFKVCKDQSACMKKGDKSPLIEEVNIRLAGFGGALPTDEFTDLTEKCIKQFQKDYMGAAQTGRLCGGVLKALDEMATKYPLDHHFNSMKCKCGVCSGFGSGRVQGNAHEYPGMHRSLLWAFRAADFYLKDVEKDFGYSILAVSSGYRCIDDNHIHHRNTVNHMGRALDVQFVKHGERTRTGNAGIEAIRSKIFVGHMGAQMRWPNKNKISLESTADGATTWVHFDVREFEAPYQQDKHFIKSLAAANGDRLVDIAARLGKTQLSLCGGAPVPQAPAAAPATGLFTPDDGKAALRYIFDKYGKEKAEIIERMYRVETSHFKSKQYQNCGTPGMEQHGSAPFYGWNGSFFTEAPTGLWGAFEGAGLSGAGGNTQVKDKQKEFVKVSSVKVGMEYIAKYIDAHDGNYARWYNTDPKAQALYRNTLASVKPRFVDSFK